MSTVAELLFSEPPDDWTVEQFNVYIKRLVALYLPVAFFMKMQDENKFNLAESLHEKIWKFIDVRVERFGTAGLEYPH